MKKSTSIILAAAIAAAAVVPTTALITHEASALDSSVSWVPAAGPGPAQPGPVTDQDKAKKSASGREAWWAVERRHALSSAYILHVTQTRGAAIADAELYNAKIPADATYQWWVDGEAATEPASLPVKTYSLPRDEDEHIIQLVFTYELGGKELTQTTHAEGIWALDRSHYKHQRRGK